MKYVLSEIDARSAARRAALLSSCSWLRSHPVCAGQSSSLAGQGPELRRERGVQRGSVVGGKPSVSSESAARRVAPMRVLHRRLHGRARTRCRQAAPLPGGGSDAGAVRFKNADGKVAPPVPAWRM
jgi:hypothetical protein